MQPRPLPPILRSPSFSTSAARQAGVRPSRLRRVDLVAPFHGSRMPANGYDGSLHARCVAYRAVMPPRQCFSHRTAALIYGLPLPSRLLSGTDLHVGTTGGGRAPKGAGVVGHRLAVEPGALRVVSGLRVPPVAEVWCQLAGELTRDELEIAGDAVVRRKAPLGTVEDLRVAAARASRRPGVARLRDAVTLVRARTDSPMESSLRLAILGAGLPEPRVNYAIDVGGRVSTHLDLAYPQIRLAFEYDGDHHRQDLNQYRTDIDRLWAIEAGGWRVLRINAGHMAGDAAVAVARVRAALMQKSPDTP